MHIAVCVSLLWRWLLNKLNGHWCRCATRRYIVLSQPKDTNWLVWMVFSGGVLRKTPERKRHNVYPVDIFLLIKTLTFPLICNFTSPPFYIGYVSTQAANLFAGFVQRIASHRQLNISSILDLNYILNTTAYTMSRRYLRYFISTWHQGVFQTATIN